VGASSGSPPPVAPIAVPPPVNMEDLDLTVQQYRPSVTVKAISEKYATQPAYQKHMKSVQSVLKLYLNKPYQFACRVAGFTNQDLREFFTAVDRGSKDFTMLDLFHTVQQGQTGIEAAAAKAPKADAGTGGKAGPSEPSTLDSPMKSLAQNKGAAAVPKVDAPLPKLTPEDLTDMSTVINWVIQNQQHLTSDIIRELHKLYDKKLQEHDPNWFAEPAVGGTVLFSNMYMSMLQTALNRFLIDMRMKEQGLTPAHLMYNDDGISVKFAQYVSSVMVHMRAIRDTRSPSYASLAMLGKDKIGLERDLLTLLDRVYQIKPVQAQVVTGQGQMQQRLASFGNNFMARYML